MANVAVVITPPGGSPTDYTNSCVFERCSFTSEWNGTPGTFDIYLRDPNLELDFTIGSEIVLTVDGVVMFGGYLLSKGMTSFAPAADTSDLEDYDLALWHLAGPDFNIALDRRVYRDTGDYLTSIRINETVDGAILREAIGSYTDMSDFDTSGIDDVATIPDVTYVTLQQGWKVRQEFETLLPFSSAVYYINGEKVIQYKSFDDVEKRWGFSDNPNNTPITGSPDEYQGATYGFRQVEGTEDGTYMANDVFVWGGSEFTGSGGTVVARVENSTSIGLHNRWQHAETHFGELGYRSQSGVDLAADALINGPNAGTGLAGTKGLKYPQWMFRFTWTSDHVPLLSGVPDHIVAGDLVTIELSVFGVTKLLPVRSLRISFPDAFTEPETGEHLVVFEGTFGLQLSDSFTLWRYILKNQARIVNTVITQAVVDDSSTTTTFGAQYSGEPTPAADSSTTVFTIPFGYIPGTTMVFLTPSGDPGGVLLKRGTDYTESDNEAGEITFAVAPATGDALFVAAYTLGQ